MRHSRDRTATPGGSIPDMARYLQVSSDIAERVAAGALAGGEELPSIRQAAQRYDTTATTIGRAWRHLADAGVIEVKDRARARVAAGGEAAARRLLGGYPALRLAGSDDPGLDIALRRAGAAVVSVGARGSFHGLTRIWRGTADAAAIHLRHRSGDGNSPFARSLLRGRQPAIIHLWRREQGLLVPPANPGRVSSPAGLRGLRIARRPFGTGTLSPHYHVGVEPTSAETVPQVRPHIYRQLSGRTVLGSSPAPVLTSFDAGSVLKSDRALKTVFRHRSLSL